MIRSVVISRKSIIKELINKFFDFDLSINNFSSLRKINNSIEILLVDISDYESNKRISNSDIVKIRRKTKVIIAILPSNDYEVFRKFDAYLFDDFVTFPFLPSHLKKVVSNPKKPYLRTLNKKKFFDLGKYNEIASNQPKLFQCEEEFVLTYESLINLGRIRESEEILEKYYKLAKKPLHPKVRALQLSIFYSDKNKLIATIERNLNEFSNENLIILHHFGVKICKAIIDEFNFDFPRGSIYLNEIYEKNIPIADECLIKRRFYRILSCSKKEFAICSILALKLKDYNFLCFLKNNIRKIKAPILIRNILVLMIKDVLVEVNKINNRSIFDFDCQKSHFLQVKELYSIKEMEKVNYQSAFILGIRDKNSRLKLGMEKISNKTMNDKFLQNYLLGKKFRLSSLSAKEKVDVAAEAPA